MKQEIRNREREGGNKGGIVMGEGGMEGAERKRGERRERKKGQRSEGEGRRRSEMRKRIKKGESYFPQ